MSSYPTFLTSFTNPYRLRFEEPCDLNHERQVIQVPAPSAEPGKLVALKDAATGRLHPSTFLQLEIGAGEVVDLEPVSEAVPSVHGSVALEERAAAWHGPRGLPRQCSFVCIIFIRSTKTLAVRIDPMAINQRDSASLDDPGFSTLLGTC